MTTVGNKWKKHNVSDETPIWFGKYKGTKLKDIPDEYFQMLLDKKIAFRSIKNYAKKRLS